jgi:AraC family transcriptional regulator
MPQYHDRIDRVRAHIRDNLAGDLSLDTLADVAAMSRFHWHRVFAAMTGETLAETVRRARLNRAAILVVATATPIAAIADRCGYPNAQVFSRAFRQGFGVTPTALRRSGARPPPFIHSPSTEGVVIMPDVVIRTEPSFDVAALAHAGPYNEIGKTFGRHWDLIVAHDLVGKHGHGVAFYYDDPSTVPPADLRSHAGVEIEAALSLPPAFDRLTIPGGRVAVLTYKGPYTGIPGAWAALYGGWLPGSGEEVADRVPYERYLNEMYNTPPEELLTEICVPLKDR